MPVHRNRAFPERGQGAGFLVMEGTGHPAGLERPDEANAIIEGFLARKA